MERAEAKGCGKDGVIYWWQCEDLEKRKKILVLLGLGQLVCSLVTGFTCAGGTSSVDYLCENMTKTQF